MRMSEIVTKRVSVLEIPLEHFADFNNASRKHYDSQNFKELAENSAIDALSMCSFYISQLSKKAVVAVNMHGINFASIDMDGMEATKNAALSLTPGRTPINTFERKVWNDDLIINVVKQGFLGKIFGRTKLIESIRIPLSDLQINNQ